MIKWMNKNTKDQRWKKQRGKYKKNNIRRKVNEKHPKNDA